MPPLLKLLLFFGLSTSQMPTSVGEKHLSGFLLKKENKNRRRFGGGGPRPWGGEKSFALELRVEKLVRNALRFRLFLATILFQRG